MAIQISGTTVVNDSRELQNIASLDSTTTSTISAASSPPTTYGAVGTYTGALLPRYNEYAGGDTIAASSLYNMTGDFSNQFERFSNNTTTSTTGLSGTWRCMAPIDTGNNFGYYGGILWVRIS